MLDVVLAATIASFFKENKTAGSLLVPYMAWSLYATALTAKIASDNPPVHSSISLFLCSHFFSRKEKRRVQLVKARRSKEENRRIVEVMSSFDAVIRGWQISNQTDDCP